MKDQRKKDFPFDGNKYVIDYLTQATTSNTLQEPDPKQAGDQIGLLDAVYLAHQNGGTEQAKQAIEKLQLLQTPAQEKPAQTRRIYHVSELSEIPDKKYLLEPYIPESSVIVLFAPSNTGKTFLALRWALEMALKHPILYLASEGKQGYKPRVDAHCQHHNLIKTDMHLYLDFSTIDIANLPLLQTVIDLWKPMKPKVVFIDTLARNMLGDENSSRDMGAFIRGCDLIRETLNATVFIIHHTGKSGGSERGSSALRGAADVMISLQNNDGLISISCDKSKDAPAFEKQYFRLEQVQLEKAQPEDNKTSCVVVPTTRNAKTDSTRLTNSQREILEMLSLAIFVEHGARMRDLQSGGLTLATSTIYRVLSNLKEAGLLRQAKKGDPYFITDAGKEAIGITDENDAEDEL